MRFIFQVICQEKLCIPYCKHCISPFQYDVLDDFSHSQFCTIQEPMNMPDICGIYRYHCLQINNTR